MASITVDVDLDEFDLDEILEEVEDRWNRDNSTTQWQRRQIENWCNDMIESDKPFIILSLLDQLKIDFLMQNLDKIKLNDLEKLI